MLWLYRCNSYCDRKVQTARTFNLTVNHRRQILSTTQGHPARWNDKTLVLFDDFVRGVFEGKIMEDVEFELFEKDRNGCTVTFRYKGPYLIVDNGYLSWSSTLHPLKWTADIK